jgi:hypothetical protein
VILADARRFPVNAFANLPEALGCRMVIFVRCEPGESLKDAFARMPREEAARILKQIVFPDGSQSAADWERTCGADL